jgi:hypothetical protein
MSTPISNEDFAKLTAKEKLIKLVLEGTWWIPKEMKGKPLIAEESDNLEEDIGTRDTEIDCVGYHPTPIYCAVSAKPRSIDVVAGKVDDKHAMYIPEKDCSTPNQESNYNKWAKNGYEAAIPSLVATVVEEDGSKVVTSAVTPYLQAYVENLESKGKRIPVGLREIVRFYDEDNGLIRSVYGSDKTADLVKRMDKLVKAKVSRIPAPPRRPSKRPSYSGQVSRGAKVYDLAERTSTPPPLPEAAGQ